MSSLFRGKFLAYLKREFQKNALNFSGQIQSLQSSHEFQNLLDTLYNKDWVVYCKPPFNSVKNILQYLGRYTHRIAISNQRIVNLSDGQVTFKWKNYADHNHIKLMTLDALEFIRRFLLHVLPNGFMKIRYYGIMSSRNRKTLLIRCKELLGVNAETEAIKESWQEILLRLTGKDLSKCPCCGKGTMVQKHTIAPSKSLKTVA